MTIPTKYLCKMGDYDITYDGVSLKAKVVDSSLVIDQLIPQYFGSEDIVGADLKNFTIRNSKSSLESFQILVLCGASRCLIIHLDSLEYMFPDSLNNFLDDRNICFVRPSIPPQGTDRQGFHFSYTGICSWSDGVAACELAARVLQKPTLMKESSFEVVAREVGVPYQDVYGSSRISSGSIMVNSKFERILTQEQVKMVAYDAFKCHRIGSKLLSSLD